MLCVLLPLRSLRSCLFRLLVPGWCARARCCGASCVSSQVLLSCCVACCMRRPKCALSREFSSCFSSSALLARSSLASIVSTPAVATTNVVRIGSLAAASRNASRAKRLVHAVHLVQHLAGLDLGHEVLRVALAVAHAHLGRLLGDRLVREDADPDAPAALDVARHRAARGLDLARGQAAAADRLQAVLAEADLVAACGNALVAALLLLAVFASSWLQHAWLLLFLASLGLRPRAARRQAARPCPAPRP